MEPSTSTCSQEEATIDISIPYDAAARLAFEATDKSMDYAEFKLQYEQQAVADVIAKRNQ